MFALRVNISQGRRQLDKRLKYRNLHRIFHCRLFSAQVLLLLVDQIDVLFRAPSLICKFSATFGNGLANKGSRKRLRRPALMPPLPQFPKEYLLVPRHFHPMAMGAFVLSEIRQRLGSRGGMFGWVRNPSRKAIRCYAFAANGQWMLARRARLCFIV
jgi:hypothetical protein